MRLRGRTLSVFGLELNKSNRLKLARAFRNCPRVDLGIDCAVEGQMGRALCDDLKQPVAFGVVQGVFAYFAGDAGAPSAVDVLRHAGPFSLLMPSAPGWAELAENANEGELAALRRYSFSSERLSVSHVDSVPKRSQDSVAVVRMGAALVARAGNSADSFVDIGGFDSPGDFEDRGVGFCALDVNGEIVGAAYSSLVCSKGIEVSVFVDGRRRREGIGTALACALVKHCLSNGIDPHWDAANRESCRLGEKLGYVATGEYDAYVLRGLAASGDAT